ncbi:MAG: hypothetical protein WBO46_23310 [Caldilineaceae bacterium]
MDNLLIVSIILAAGVAAGWFYWQTQKTERRMTEVAANLAQQASLVGEMVDEVFAASQYLYQEMDRLQALVDQGLMASPSLSNTRSGELETQTDLPSMQMDPKPVSDAVETVPLSAVPTPAQESSVENAPVLASPAESFPAESLPAAEADLSPHLTALRMAMDKTAPVEIARQTGIGIEELRLLLRFQDAVNSVAG